MPRNPRARRAKQSEIGGAAPASQPPLSEPTIGEQLGAIEREEREFDLRDLAVELVTQEMTRCKTELQFGPGRTGWRSNEAKRAPLEARIALLQELLDRASNETDEIEQIAEA